MQAEQPSDARAGTPEQKAAAGKINAGIAQRAWLKHLTLGESRGANGLRGLRSCWAAT